ncbi:MAG TPA: inositol monophosphatase family protein [Roseiflexaceae bacterium]|nr:inositol monophosphatase family protein [Roseiflexaceae bacterium]
MAEYDLDELRAWVQAAGDVAQGYFNNVAGRRKADRTLVTEADMAIEHMLVELLSARYPGHGILGEEHARHGVDREFVWAIDPLDGTASFVAGLPIWGISVGLLRRGRPYMGLLYFPMLRDWYWAEPDSPAQLNGAAIQVAPPGEWDSEDWLAVPSNVHRRFDIDFRGKSRSLGSAAASICYVARGSAVGALLAHSAIWDVAAALAVLHAAGGVAVTLSGADLDTRRLMDGSQQPEPVVVGAPAHVAALRDCIRVRPRR